MVGGRCVEGVAERIQRMVAAAALVTDVFFDRREHPLCRCCCEFSQSSVDGNVSAVE